MTDHRDFGDENDNFPKREPVYEWRVGDNGVMEKTGKRLIVNPFNMKTEPNTALFEGDDPLVYLMEDANNVHESEQQDTPRTHKKATRSLQNEKEVG